MLMDIFSSFDDHNSVFLEAYMLMWTTSFILLFLSVMIFWAAPGRWTLFLKHLYATISSLIKVATGKYLGYFSLSMVSLFLMILFMNLCSLISYTFGETSHLAITLSLSLPFWLTLIVSGTVFNPQKMIASLLPSGAPPALNPFLILIETVSIGVRPLILALRLGANITAGHIVMSIIGGFLEEAILSSSGSMLICSVFEAFYTIFEFGICFIQAYIFVLLLVLYSDDHPH
uniref:ATP synthase F0 subunit 6 n=1 Tax=Dracogyra subfusca TaxID=2038759 RepID=UPI0021D533D8|nr:ATP synthase F0 subunit 6 [Dracogyra subfuscus]UXG19114.1 ATP synthase F0 subunit 6 [Dracogyra subfuscus]